MAQLVASMTGVVLGGVVEILGSYTTRGEIFTTQSFLKVLKMVYMALWRRLVASIAGEVLGGVFEIALVVKYLQHNLF